ncbi:translation elongation factor EF-1 subunit alpha [Candidatus Bathyarchaeota archaeon]|jgi:elongation factor 1-alpha|nr:translation elongation factor EF-1 subunit alpha [Candidatus Bathyarchaeota archaeon]MDP6049036.1 translation elongation factor EF-1 subunit alpha [Candidatus Bathyarchaeota archaeon]|tara:strand:+ start:151 stop:1449 length:1299 start_codon:yes stop_codon:yes gene_type:complete
MSGKEKPHLNLIIIGHVDHGKSTSIGHLFYDAGAISEKVIRDFEEEAKALGKESFKYAWVLDKLKEERERGLTIDLAFYKLESSKHFFTVIDSPGHRDFIKNMVTGASQADGAVIFISAKRGEYEAGTNPGGQTREHAFLASTLGVTQLVVAINKMDDATVDWAEGRYEEVKDGMTRLLKQVGYNPDKIQFIPTSGWTGDNLFNKSDKMDWYKGPTVLEALDEFTVPEKPVDRPLRIPVQEVYTIRGVGTVPVGKIETGTLKMDSNLIFMPSKETGQVKTIETHYTRMNEAGPGDNIGFNVKGIARDKIKRGDVAGYLNDVPKVAKAFNGRIFIIHHPTAVAEGYTPVLHIHTAQIAVRFDKLISKLDPRTGQVVEENPSYLRTGDAAVVRFVPLQPAALEKYTDFPQLGRFALRDMGTTIGAGIVLEIEEE